MDSLREMKALLEELGLTLPTPAYLIGVLLFGVIGIVLFVLGRRRRKPAVRWLGLTLMLYPYLIWGTAALYVVGAVLCVAAIWFWRRP
jgi:hypothetical protein